MKKFIIETDDPRPGEEKREPTLLFFSEMELENITMYMEQHSADTLEEAIMKAILR